MTSHVHFKFARILLTITGIWPVLLTGYKLKLYNAYFYISFTYYILFDISYGAMVFIARGNFVETAGTLGVTIIYVINIYKVLICRSAVIRKIIQEIETRESQILKGGDQKIREIYKEHAKSAFRSMSFYVSVGSVGISLYFITPIVKNFLAVEDDVGVKHKYLIFSSWFPFDSEKHYVASYMIQFFGGFYGYAYIVHAGAFFFAILKYIIGQIKILQHIFQNFHYYILKYSAENPSRAGKAQEIFTKICVKEHQYIIGLVERLDGSIKTFMLLEFLISSFQLSLVVFQILQTNTVGVERVAVLSYLLTLCVQLFLFYWNANEIIIQSSEIAQAVFECEWYVLDKNVQKMLMLVIQRAQKPMGISIGPIYKVKVDSLITIFKAIYSYMAIIQK